MMIGDLKRLTLSAGISASLVANIITAHIMDKYPPLSQWTMLNALRLVISTPTTVTTMSKMTVILMKGQGSSVIFSSHLKKL